MYDVNTYNTASNASGLGVLAGVNASSTIISLAVAVVSIVALWKIFEKAGIEGWKSIIRIYNMVVLFQLVDLNPWLLLLALIPCLGWIAIWILSIVAYVRLAKKMGQDSSAFIVFIAVLSP